MDKKLNFVTKVTEVILNLIVMLQSVVILSFIFFYLINKTKSIVPFYIGILICILIGSKIGRLFKNVNNSSEYNELFKEPSITNYSSIIKNIFSKINIFSRTVSKETKEINMLIMPNIFFIILIFCYSYLLLCFSFSLSLNNNPATPTIITFFKHMIVAYIVFYIIFCTLKIFNIIDVNILKTKHISFILNIGIYNLITSAIIALLISFIYFNVIKTFFKKNLFFQNTKFCKKTEDNDELCYYEPIRANWGY